MSTEIDKKSRIDILRYTIVTGWHWTDIKNEDCAICRGSLNLPCVSCSTNNKKEKECVPLLGTCGHCFHEHCLGIWLQKQETCPLCQKKWVHLKIKENEKEKVKITNKIKPIDVTKPQIIKKQKSVVNSILDKKKMSNPVLCLKTSLEELDCVCDEKSEKEENESITDSEDDTELTNDSEYDQTMDVNLESDHDSHSGTDSDSGSGSDY